MFFKRFKEDIDSFMARDPAARTRMEVFLCYPGLHSMMLYYLSNALWLRGWRLSGRMISQFGRMLTGIEIHPGARIGKHLFIDHGAGVVIGETSDIGDDVTIYQGVTLGGISPAVDSRTQVDKKRHPTLGNGVIIGSGAQILGPILIGEGARIGANSVVHKDIPPGATAVGIPARIVMPRDKNKPKEFVAYGEPVEGCPDPVLQVIETLQSRVATLMKRVDELGKDGPKGKKPQRPKSSRKKSSVVIPGGNP
ncbi:MAG: serine O-acetyltransferase [Rhodospirillales bacterium RIFCSPLOWO2_12_FULL_58_28]|nr:MAG: serine O-acetyltransferase [Rhodospirillales bacterium RIFCSPLOWO2_02_FULL_58_16]OHC77417.1 MAG: serine O-acetyltransferase [Rhodospirillales bacterium RIFCSPLOWO2_12_FULL_58_28]